MKLDFVHFEKWSWHQNESFCSYAYIAFFRHPNIEKGQGQGKGKGKGEGVLFRILQIILRILENHNLNNMKKINFSIVKMNKIIKMIHLEGGGLKVKKNPM